MAILTRLRLTHTGGMKKAHANLMVFTAYLNITMPKTGWEGVVDEEVWSENAIEFEVAFSSKCSWLRRAYLQWKLRRIVKRPRWRDMIQIVYEV